MVRTGISVLPDPSYQRVVKSAFNPKELANNIAKALYF